MGGPIILTILSALLLLLAFPPFNIFPLAFIAPIFFLFDCIHAPSLASAIKKGCLFGFIFMGFFHTWMFTLSHWSSAIGIGILWLCFMAFLSLFYGAFAGATFFFRRSLWIIPILWAAMEYLKSLGPIGNPSGTLGYSQTLFTPFLQLASLGGVYFLSFLILSVTTLLLERMLPLKQSYPKFLRRLSYSFLLFFFIFGTLRLFSPLEKSTQTLSVTVAQPNHSQDDKLTPKKWPELRQDFLKLNEESLNKSTSDCIFWPETITPGLNLNHVVFMTNLIALCEKHKTNIVIGTPLLRNAKYYNSIAMINQHGESPISYDKRLLMPFGEYWPGRTLFRCVGLGKIVPEIDFSKGIHDQLIPLTTSQGQTLIGSALCLESLYPWFFRESTRNGAGLLFTAVNNAWFLNSSVAEKHVDMTILRAVENNRFTLQSANTGISAIISSKGKMIASAPLNTQAMLRATVPILTQNTPYSRNGESWLVVLLSLGLPFALLARVRRPKRN